MCACIAAGLALGLTSVEYKRVFWLLAALGAQLRLTANMMDGMVALVPARGFESRRTLQRDSRSFGIRRCSSAQGTPGAETLRLVISQRFWQSSLFTFAPRKKIAGSPDEFCGPMAKQHRMLVITIACLYSVIVPRSWQIFHLDGLDFGIMSLAFTLIIAGCVITVVRRYKRIARALR